MTKKLQEMPHFMFGDGTPFDVELEAHTSDAKELLDYFHAILLGSDFEDKYGESHHELDLQQRKELAEVFLNDSTIKLIIFKKYGEPLYRDFLLMVQDTIQTLQ